MNSSILRGQALLLTWSAIALFATAGCTPTTNGSPGGSEGCEAGTTGCVCYGNDTCNLGLSCVDSICVADSQVDDDAGLDEPDADDAGLDEFDAEDSNLGDAWTDSGESPDTATDSGESQKDGGEEIDAGQDADVGEADECEGIEAPAGAIFDGSRNTLPDFFGPGSEWASGISVGTELFELNEYVSLEFVAPDAAGHIAWSVGHGNTGAFRVRLSSCAHDLRLRDEAPTDVTYCTLDGEGGWTSGLIDGTPDPDDWRCNLVPGETYYINIMLEGCPQSQCNFYGTLREI